MTFERILYGVLVVTAFCLAMLGMTWGLLGEHARAAYLMAFAVYLRTLVDQR